VSDERIQRILVVERRIKASPRTVFSFFTDRDRWLAWQGIEAEIDPRPGGVFRMNVRGDGLASGTFVAVDPYTRIVFTWGWEIDGSPMPPGSTTVEINLEPENGHTILRLRHTGLPPHMFDPHREGWNHYLDRLLVRVHGGDPGPDLTIGATSPPGRTETVGGHDAQASRPPDLGG
jgi:uncharacterized protein YndB with AHSA1/START domain